MAIYNKKKEEEQIALEQQKISNQLQGDEGIKEPMQEPLHSLDEEIEQETTGRVGKIGKEEIEKAMTTLQKYKDGKATLEKRIIENERWYKLQHWEVMRNAAKTNDPEPTSAWLLNSILNKHADAMDNYPEPNILAREKNDKEDAKNLSSIIPVILEQNDYESTYSDKWWQKLKNGTGVEGVFWSNDKQNGLGDIEIKNCDLLNLFWQPGIKNIQKSKNFFNIEVVDNEDLEVMYPYLKDKLGKGAFEKAEYVHDENIDTQDKTTVIDWYYKVRVKTELASKEVLHYCKFCNGEVIYASENDPEYAEKGFYDHAKYPFEFDVLFTEEDSPCGFGYIDIMKSPQIYIDKLNQIIIKNAFLAGKKRWFIRSNGSVNEKEYADVDNDFVHVEGNLTDNDIKEIVTAPLSEIYLNMVTQKIDELKETSGNRDFSQGGTASGVTAASAIAALQEAGSKLSRDMIKSSYRSFTNNTYLVIELVRQFYTEPRSFRITGEKNEEEFVQYSNKGIAPQPQDTGFGLSQGDRTPLFDIKVKSQKSNPFSKMAQNEMAKELYGAGMFNPQMAEQALVALEMMDFEGKDTVMLKIQQNSMLMQQLQQMQEQMAQMAQIIDAQNGTTITQGMAQNGQPQQPLPSGGASLSTVSTNALGAAFQSSKNNTANTAKERAVNVANPS